MDTLTYEDNQWEHDHIMEETEDLFKGMNFTRILYTVQAVYIIYTMFKLWNAKHFRFNSEANTNEFNCRTLINMLNHHIHNTKSTLQFEDTLKQSHL